MIAKSWLHDKYVQNWFDLLGNKRTIGNYSNEFPIFLEWVQQNTEYKTPSEIIDSRLQHLTTTDLLKRRYWESQVVKFKNSLQAKNLRMATVKGYLRTVQSFFSKNGVKLAFSRGELKVEPSEKDKVRHEWIPSNEEIRLLYRMAKDSRDRGIILTLYQSGFSEIDLCNMKIEDFDFYDSNGNWKLGLNEDLYHERLREKTNIPQKTCISREALEEIRIMLQSRGFPKSGHLFISFRGKPLDAREINLTLKAIVEQAFKGKVKEWQTKHLRDAFMNGLLQARIPQEVKDSMVGHKRQGAREDYGLTEQTIKTAYSESFKFLTINGFGSTQRTVEELKKEFEASREEDRKKIDKLVEIMTNLQTENSELKTQLSRNENSMKEMFSKFDKRLSRVEVKKKMKPKLEYT